LLNFIFDLHSLCALDTYIITQAGTIVNNNYPLVFILI
jgi:hypothetical protein